MHAFTAARSSHSVYGCAQIGFSPLIPHDGKCLTCKEVAYLINGYCKGCNGSTTKAVDPSRYPPSENDEGSDHDSAGSSAHTGNDAPPKTASSARAASPMHTVKVRSSRTETSARSEHDINAASNAVQPPRVPHPFLLPGGGWRLMSRDDPASMPTPTSLKGMTDAGWRVYNRASTTKDVTSALPAATSAAVRTEAAAAPERATSTSALPRAAKHTSTARSGKMRSSRKESGAAHSKHEDTAAAKPVSAARGYPLLAVFVMAVLACFVMLGFGINMYVKRVWRNELQVLQDQASATIAAIQADTAAALAKLNAAHVAEMERIRVQLRVELETVQLRELQDSAKKTTALYVGQALHAGSGEYIASAACPRATTPGGRSKGASNDDMGNDMSGGNSDAKFNGGDGSDGVCTPTVLFVSDLGVLTMATGATSEEAATSGRVLWSADSKCAKKRVKGDFMDRLKRRGEVEIDTSACATVSATLEKDGRVVLRRGKKAVWRTPRQVTKQAAKQSVRSMRFEISSNGSIQIAGVVAAGPGENWHARGNGPYPSEASTTGSAQNAGVPVVGAGSGEEWHAVRERPIVTEVVPKAAAAGE